jgi:CarD family transcriptional regulator
MTFAVGDKVVYPHHGAAIIEGKEKRVFDGQKTDYFVLRITYGDLKVSIPVDKADEIGLREVINDEEVEEVFAVLRKKEARMPTNWSRRFKNHVEKLKSGDIYQVAEVVRNLSIREADKGLSAGEKRMLARARQILVSELTFALNVDEETAESRLDDVLAGRDVPPPAKKKAPAKKAPVKKAAVEKAPAAAKRAPASEPTGKAAPAAKAAPEKAPVKKAAAEKAPAAKKAPVKKAAVEKAPAAKKAPAKKAAAK